MGKRKFWNWVRDSDTGERTLVLNGTIAEESWFGDEVTPAIFRDELTKGEGDITVWINSLGGDAVLPYAWLSFFSSFLSPHTLCTGGGRQYLALSAIICDFLRLYANICIQ